MTDHHHEIPPADETRLPPSRNPMKRAYNWVLHWADTRYGVLALFILSFAESSFFPIPPDVLLIALCMGRPRRWVWFAAVCTAASVSGAWGGYAIGYYLSDSLGEALLRFVGWLVMHGGAEMAPSFEQLGDAIAALGGHDAMALRLQEIAATLKGTGAAPTTPQEALWLRAQALAWFNCPQALPGVGTVVLGPWAVGVAGFTPIPYKVFTIAAGMFEMPLVPFTVASILSRGARFFLVAGLIGLTYRFFGDRLKDFIDKYFNLLSVAFVILLIAGFAMLKLFH